MSAFSSRPWGRYVSVRDYLRTRNGREESIDSHLRKWPTGKGQ
jgi:hypothetical protein